MAFPSISGTHQSLRASALSLEWYILETQSIHWKETRKHQQDHSKQAPPSPRPPAPRLSAAHTPHYAPKGPGSCQPTGAWPWVAACKPGCILHFWVRPSSVKCSKNSLAGSRCLVRTAQQVTADGNIQQYNINCRYMVCQEGREGGRGNPRELQGKEDALRSHLPAATEWTPPRATVPSCQAYMCYLFHRATRRIKW